MGHWKQSQTTNWVCNNPIDRWKRSSPDEENGPIGKWWKKQPSWDKTMNVLGGYYIQVEH